MAGRGRTNGEDRLPRSVRGVLFDLDGTLYVQPALRFFMALELVARSLATGLPAAVAEARSLAVFRRVREDLRTTTAGTDELLDVSQFTRAAVQAGCDPARLRALVEEWIYRRPLKYLRVCRRPGMAALLEDLRRRGVRLGVLSDYPVAAKLAALDLTGCFDTTLCATDVEIGAFKPHPRGFERALQLWNLTAAEVLYVGDRPDVDRAGAERAGMACWILTSRPGSVRSLHNALCRCC